MPDGPKQDVDRRASESSIGSNPGSPTERRRSSVNRFANLEALKRPQDEQSVNRRASLQDSYGKVGIFGSMWNNFTRGSAGPKSPQQSKEPRDTSTLRQYAPIPTPPCFGPDFAREFERGIVKMATATTTTSHPPTDFPDPTPINLNRLLSRLEHTVLIDPPSELRRSSYTRAKVSANIEHARTLLLSLEHSATSLPSKSKKSALQSDLQQKRELIKQLNQRLYELDQLNDSETEGSADSEDDEEDNFPTYAPHRAADAGIEVNTTSGEGNEALENAARGLTSELRRRGAAKDADIAATGNSLFPSKPKTTTGESSHAQTDAVLSSHRNEQESLETSLLDMARQLKQQSLHFSQTLEGDKSVVDRAIAGLDKNALGMDAAGQKMGTLRRMTEGKGWWDRMKLYAMIFGLWVFAFLIVFVGPKIRF
ncbi:hypothetical protein N0V90_001388 [Kalmusia sp. IMI 367209]|nr:hypothetical protein N0V90_001388 [Kalmusia sp. IMI 367209]